MSDTDQTSADSEESSESTQDPIKNMKAEMDRKFKNITETLKQQNDALAQQLTAINQAVTPKKQEAKEENLDDLSYTNPTLYAQKIAEMAANRVDQRLNQSSQINSTLQQMISEYPELQDQSSRLYKKAIQTFAGLSDSEKASANGVKYAIREAAADEGIVPASKRSSRRNDDNDDFSFGGDVSNDSDKRKDRRSDTKVDPRTVELSRLLGRDVNDPKVKASLEKTVKRKNYTKYE